MAPDRTIAIIGLGNPGKEYENTRHNAGFLALDAVAGNETFKPIDAATLSWQTKKNLYSALASLTIHGTHLLLVKPQTFMNLSGKAVAAIKQFYRLEPKNIWVIHDDLDLPLGKAQVRLGGGLAGHHGLESIAESLGATDFGRIRIGIRGHELRSFHGEQGIDTSDFVLGQFTDREMDILSRMLVEVTQCISDLLNQKELKNHTLTVAGYETFSSPTD